MLSQENVTLAIQRLAQVVNDSINSPVDQTRKNLNTAAIILNIIANHVQILVSLDGMVRISNMHNIVQSPYVLYHYCTYIL